MIGWIFITYALVLVSSEEVTKKENQRNATKNFFMSIPAIRIIPADILRDYPDRCFASTQCKLYEPNQSWNLVPYCGIATCINNPTGEFPSLVEQVSDCGPEPIQVPSLKEGETPKCNISSELTRSNSPYPDCCPIYVCEEGYKLEFPLFGPEETEQPTTEKKNEGKQ